MPDGHWQKGEMDKLDFFLQQTNYTFHSNVLF